ncbi:hypothetical protein NUU61_006564 [Penicillium alfredii]|uniref:Auxiliary Activity family 9 catalytic domain-containing protein n=1 Tax=Penicillium alfredii TaxID=1506179 RepID=A0A9W9K3G8_9EURO|nr:uncharacterized protein NUU61_006564 [Penicillium alfredii]KAJ5091694.1 hypothetical protein NUU61_006564 [Penicillium alfredii]
MSVSKIAGIILGSTTLVAGHGYVSGAVVDGQYYGGYIVDKYSYTDSPPKVIGWSEDATDLGFVDGSGYSDADIICHKNAEPGALSASVKAGGKVELQWTEWPESHHGPVITYLADCNGDCSSVDKTALKFFKIDQAGLIDDSNVPGTWATDKLISNNNSYTVTIPSSIAAGNYVLRHEIIALHSAGDQNGAQNYPQCLNLKVTGGGSDAPTGTLGTALYKNTNPGIKVNIYQTLDSYKIPGPALYSGASSGSATAAPSGSASASASGSGDSSPSASTSGSSSAVGSVTPLPTASASPVSVSPLSTSPVIPPVSKPTGPPHHSSSRRQRVPRASSGPSFSVPWGPGFPPNGGATATATETAVPQVTNQPAPQTPSSSLDDVTVTASSPGGRAAQSSSPADGNAPVPVPSSSATPSAVPSSGSNTSSDSGSGSDSGSNTSSTKDWASYLDSLTAEQFLNLLRQTVRWLATDKKHARDLSS